jgi:hypothetical protein
MTISTAPPDPDFGELPTRGIGTPDFGEDDFEGPDDGVRVTCRALDYAVVVLIWPPSVRRHPRPREDFEAPPGEGME